ncbi:peptidase C14, partial [Gloeophyllum trabeum ATCC 11539]
PDFRYSRCTGRKKALCIGIDYTGQPDIELRGCVNDAKNMFNFLQENYGFHKKDMVLLRDDAHYSRDIPTKENILNAMRWLVNDAQPNDSLFIHYSGHGEQTRDLEGDEVDGLDEAILPLDHQKAGMIIDDLMNEMMVRPLPRGCRLTAVFDSCHSGSMLDLPFQYNSGGGLKPSQVTPGFRKARSTPADVVSFSGCKDTETSAETCEEGLFVGAMSYVRAISLLAQMGHNEA